MSEGGDPMRSALRSSLLARGRRALPAVVALLAAGGIVAGVLALGPRLHPASVASRPTPSPSASPTGEPTDVVTPAPTPVPTALPTATLHAVVPPPTRRPTPTPLPWTTPPQTVTQPELVYELGAPVAEPNGSYDQHLIEVDWTGTVRGSVDVPGYGTQTNPEPMSVPGRFNQSPDGSRIVIDGVSILRADGSSAGRLAPGADALTWDGDNLHLCRADGTGGVTISWVSPTSSRPVTTLPAVSGSDFWWIAACSSARNRVVVVRENRSIGVVEMRSIELSTGRLVSDRSSGFSGGGVAASGDGTVVAIDNDTSSVLYDPDTGARLQSIAGQVQRLSWFGARALVSGGGGHSVVDSRTGATLWSQSDNGGASWNEELTDDLAMKYSQFPNGQEQDYVVIITPSGSASKHLLPS